jgi:O-succinylbenzoic acid--CoA ligase
VSSLRPVRGRAREIQALLRSWNDDADPPPLVVETSGSTGEPKRVVLSRRAMRASAEATHARLGGAGQWLLQLPATYVAGLQVLFRSVLSGTDAVVRDDHPDLASAVDAMAAGRRYVSLVPTQLARMLRRPADVEALRRFDAVLVGGAGLDQGQRSAAEAAGVRVVTTYGMSETCGGCVYDGVPLDGVAVAVGTDGRVRLGGPVLFDGYDGRPDLTAEVLVDGWFLTSDTGRVDDDGRLEVLGRADDVVVSGGVNVPAPAVAARLREHAAVAAAEVVGVPDEEWGHRVVAVVVPAGDVRESATSLLPVLRDFVGDRLPRTWAPREVVLVPELPLLPNGTVDRLALAELARRPAAAQAADPA